MAPWSGRPTSEKTCVIYPSSLTESTGISIDQPVVEYDSTDYGGLIAVPGIAMTHLRLLQSALSLPGL